MIKLKPCPFCGGPVSMGEGYNGYLSIHCSAFICGANPSALACTRHFQTRKLTEEALAEKWNGRRCAEANTAAAVGEKA